MLLIYKDFSLEINDEFFNSSCMSPCRSDYIFTDKHSAFGM